MSAALLARERTGKGQLVTTSLLRIGAYVLGWDVNATLRMGIRATPFTRTTMPNPVISPYRAGCGRWFWLLGLQGQRHWPDLVRAVERPEWLTDERYATMAGRRDNCASLVEQLDAIFATRTLEDWGPRFDRAGLWWAPVQTTEDLIVDPTTGVPVNGHLDDYKLPTIADVPEIVSDFVNVPDENLPNLGSKGLGEPPIVPTAAAIANAFAHATGRRAAALPLTPARVLETLA